MADIKAATEFEIIATFFGPLAANAPGACGLKDDAAWLRSRPGFDLVLTTDAIVSGVHFLPEDPADLVARKLLGVNLSDLAAKGAEPDGYLLTLALPSPDREWLRGFAEGLAADQQEYGIALMGGDTVATAGPIVLSVTAFGWVPEGAMLRRSGARPDDRVYVTGTLGDAALGLGLLIGQAERILPEHAAFLAGRYRRPRPRIRLGPRLIGLAHAAADISDGLLADLGHVCAESCVGAEIRSDALPLSDAVRACGRAGVDPIRAALSGGDDYELVFTAPPAAAPALAQLAAEIGIPITDIGRIVAGAGSVAVRDATGRAMDVDRTGWVHFVPDHRSGAETEA